MNLSIRTALAIVGAFWVALALSLAIPLALALADQDGTWRAFIYSALCIGVPGALLAVKFRGAKDIQLRDGFLIVVMVWLACGLAGALPFLFSGVLPNVTDAVFESVSGFTTTGSSVIVDVSAQTRSILLWRSMTHWFGGMGFIVLSLAIMPLLQIGGMQLYRAEVSGPTKDRLRPRVEDTARVLWSIYVGITVVATLLLAAGEMDWFDAVNHAMATVATGGFSTRSGGPGEFQSPYTHAILTFFMFVSAINFALHFRIFQTRSLRPYLGSQELRLYATILLVVAAVAVVLNGSRQLDDIIVTVATVVSVGTCTGFTFADFNTWPVVLQLLLLGLMVIGGMAGSTAGAMKVVRVLITGKHAIKQLQLLLHPRAVVMVKLDHKPVDEHVVQSILGFGALYTATSLAAVVVLAAVGVTHVEAMSGVLSAMGGVGPGLGSIGPTASYAHVPSAAKWTLTVCMILGRLELFTVLVLFVPSFWRR